MPRRKTHEEFIKEVFDLVGNTYDILGVYSGSGTPVIMRHNCDKCNNYEFPMRPNNFLSSGQRCPKCAGVEKKTHDEYLKEVFEIVDDEYSVLETYINANTPIKMRHNNESCNFHMYPVKPNDFLTGSRCPKCYGTFKKTHEEFVQQVYRLVKNEYSVLGTYSKGITPILMRHNCKECNNHEFPMRPSMFLHGQRCPKCFGKFKKTTEQFIDEIFKLEGSSYTVLGDYVNAKTPIKIRHNNASCDNYEYDVKPNVFLNGRRCPKCNEPKGERRIKKWLDEHQINYESQKEFHGLLGLGGGNLSYDFHLPEHNLLIEYQGQFHDGSGADYTRENLAYQKEHDRRKREYAEKNNIELLEIWYWDFDNVEDILLNKLITSNIHVEPELNLNDDLLY